MLRMAKNRTRLMALASLAILALGGAGLGVWSTWRHTPGPVLPEDRGADASESRGEQLAPLHVTRPGLLALAAVSQAEAWSLAARFAGAGRPRAATLEVLGGRLVYVLTFEQDSRTSAEVVIDAASGEIIFARSDQPPPAASDTLAGTQPPPAVSNDPDSTVQAPANPGVAPPD
jgi:hypothetical protein